MTKNKRFSPASEKGHFDGLVDEGKYLQQSSLYKQILQRTQRRLKTSAVSSFSVVNNSCYSCPFVVDQYAIRDTQYAQRKIASTLVERALQIHPFLTNKANFQKSQMHVNIGITKDYGIMDTWWNRKNKANSKPIQSQNKANTNPIYPVVASGEAGTNPISLPLWSTSWLVRHPSGLQLEPVRPIGGYTFVL